MNEDAGHVLTGCREDALTTTKTGPGRGRGRHQSIIHTAKWKMHQVKEMQDF